jgi:hypothetical protein
VFLKPWFSGTQSHFVDLNRMIYVVDIYHGCALFISPPWYIPPQLIERKKEHYNYTIFFQRKEDENACGMEGQQAPNI